MAGIYTSPFAWSQIIDDSGYTSNPLWWGVLRRQLGPGT